jgi:hypothetical protein
MTDWTHNKFHPQIELLTNLIKRDDQARLDHEGGYPSDWLVVEDVLIRAEPDHNGASRLYIVPVADFIAERLASHDDT